MWQKSGMDEVTKSKVLNESSLQSKEFHDVKYPSNNPSYISGKLLEFSKAARSKCK